MLKARSWKKNEAIKIKTTEIRLVNETILVINKIGKKMTAQIKKKCTLYPNKKPAEVATALPPLNFKKIGKA
ncbi:hypothetical protein LHEJCM1005_16540 [Lactobacillus helveticus]|uniref:Uncharacterized protein n=1 Tax=Lactobacillus helveticus TaxID=1587 RepID=A0AAV4E6V8_LACHE|nr:hypothetical protein LBHL_11270 [Lactobacillus helveticus]GFP07362.1 hypothetical protein LHEJCM1005_16540 [Lactobacillus helveticus]GFP08686.1 hypothetical protein LHEJCM1006_08320 [Lactobacillus helveticus]GFP11424.1 hypothetical protein LHEJCM1007_15330 [Lactobacillus helveticus]GFP13204.1 hypothetical protein LHEJCM1062_10760 [Lactobacillus helveticus]